MKTFLLAAAAISLALPCSAKPDTPKISLVPMPSGGITYCGQGAQAGPAQISIDPTLAREEYLLSTEGGSIEIKAGSDEGQENDIAEIETFFRFHFCDTQYLCKKYIKTGKQQNIGQS